MKKTFLTILPAFAILLCIAVIAYAAYKDSGPDKNDANVTTVDAVDPEAVPAAYTLTDDDLLTDFPSAGKFAGSDVIIGGDYILSGDYRDTVVIDAGDRVVHLVLDNANILSNDGPAIYVKSASKVVITAVEGTENTIADCSYHSDTDLSSAIYSDSDITINGKGTIKITGFFKDAIATDRVFKAIDATLRIKAKRDAVSADDGMLLRCSLLVAEAERNDLKSDSHKQSEKGNIYILGGDNDLIAGNIGILGGSDLYVSDCKLSMGCVVGDIDVQGMQYIGEGCL